MAMSNESVRSIFVTGLRNAHAMEAQAIQLLERQIERLDDFPDLKSRMQQHLTETHRQQERIDRILGSMSEQPSSMKDTAMSILGNLATVANMPADDEVLKNSFASFAFENYETATYKSLIGIAQEAGALDAAKLLQRSCEEEQAMATWLDRQLPSVTERYIARSTARDAA